jgi:iron complex transport system substrate-binding protein
MKDSSSRLQPPRIVSLIASATEIVCALGFEDQLVGRSHECDFPPSVKRLPQLTSPKFKVEGTSLEIDQRVKAILLDALSVYRVDPQLLEELKPTHIITQSQCEVCAVSLKESSSRSAIDHSNPVIISEPVRWMMCGQFKWVKRLEPPGAPTHRWLQSRTI